MNKKIAKQLRQRKQKIRKRLDKRTRPANIEPMLNPGNIHYEISDRKRRYHRRGQRSRPVFLMGTAVMNQVGLKVSDNGVGLA